MSESVIKSNIYVTLYSTRKAAEQTTANLEMICKELFYKITQKAFKGDASDKYFVFYATAMLDKAEAPRLETLLTEFTDIVKDFPEDSIYFGIDYLGPMVQSENAIDLSDRVRVSDPCYDKDTWCAGTVENVLPGRYLCYKQYSAEEGRIAAIQVVHEDHADCIDINNDEMELTEIDVGVDSGQAGIYDLNYFLDHCNNDNWYENVCNKTYLTQPNPDYVPVNVFTEKYLIEHPGSDLPVIYDAYYNSSCSVLYETVPDAQIIDGKGYVSAAGYGDGSYNCLLVRDINDKVVSVKLVFIDMDHYDDEEKEN